MKRKFFVLINPYAGSRKQRKVVKELIAFLEARQLEYRLSDTGDSGGVVKALEALDKTFTDLIIVGGDGTINETINAISFDIPVSIFPVGTGNDFVKNITIGSSLRDWLDTAVNGIIRKIDLGKCNGRLFANGVGIGFDGQIVEDMLTKRVPLLRGHAAYYYHVLRILGSYQVRTFNYQVDDIRESNDLILMTVGNGTTFGGGFKLMPEAKPDDGLLEVCTIGDLSPIRRFLNIHLLSGGTHGRLSEVQFYKAKKITVEANPLLFAHIDGERMGQPPFSIDVLPKVLKIRVVDSSS